MERVSGTFGLAMKPVPHFRLQLEGDNMNTYLEITSEEGGKKIGYAGITFTENQMILTFSKGFGPAYKVQLNLEDITYVAKNSLIGGNTYTFNCGKYRITLYENGLGNADYLDRHFKYLMVQM